MTLKHLDKDKTTILQNKEHDFVSDENFYYLSEIQIISFDENRKLAEVELLPEGKWRRPQGNGWFEVTKNKIKEFIENFKRGITGKELPLDFNHAPDSRKTPGWIVDIYEKTNPYGNPSIYAKLQITDPEVWERIKQKSLKYISPQIVYGWVEPKSNTKFDVIKSAALTNYAYIKNMEAIKILNFEEIQKREEGTEKVKYEEFMAKLEEIFAMELEEAEETKKLGELFESVGATFQDETVAKAKRGEDTNYETAEEKKKREEEEEKKKKELAEKNKTRPYYKATSRPYYKDYKKVSADGSRPEGLDGGVPSAEFAEKERNLNSRIQNLEDQLKSAEVDKVVNGLKRAGKLFPAVAPIVKAILMRGESYTLNFEDKETNIHDLLIEYFEKTPKLVNFEEIAAQELESESVKSMDRMTQEEINAEAEKLAKDEGIRFEDALDKVADKHFKAPK